MHKMIIACICLVLLFGCLSLDAATTSNSKYDSRGFLNPNYQDPYYNSRYYKNREYYQNRQYYDNFYKQYNPAVVAAEARIIEQDVKSPQDGAYAYSYETENGIHAEERAVPVNVGQQEPKQVVEGSYSYLTPEGMRVGVKYTADENGFHPVITYDGINAAQYIKLQQQAADVIITQLH